MNPSRSYPVGAPVASRPVMAAALAAALVLLARAVSGPGAPPAVAGKDARVVKDASGLRLQVDGRDFMVFGMNWDYFPIGTNYDYAFWKQPDDFIEAALAREMPLMKAMA